MFDKIHMFFQDWKWDFTKWSTLCFFFTVVWQRPIFRRNFLFYSAIICKNSQLISEIDWQNWISFFFLFRDLCKKFIIFFYGPLAQFAIFFCDCLKKFVIAFPNCLIKQLVSRIVWLDEIHNFFRQNSQNSKFSTKFTQGWFLIKKILFEIYSIFSERL